uniref:peptide-methionine (R)-S-oxide reductase n=1 Tax=Timspurckia oligopyrenoides TaxID=708627 RepID=A0A7S1ES47_9RHOD|mmetsp:Transcript_373/g.676  ORF Transcript_373/g.676 Transcript_373/m.676 type:complete len:277 (+) Transcript_373:61-891(+)
MFLGEKKGKSSGESAGEFSNLKTSNTKSPARSFFKKLSGGRSGKQLTLDSFDGHSKSFSETGSGQGSPGKRSKSRDRSNSRGSMSRGNSGKDLFGKPLTGLETEVKVAPETITNHPSLRVVFRRGHGGSRGKTEVLFTFIKIRMDDEEWRAKLTPEEYSVLRDGHFEPPFKYLGNLAVVDKLKKGIFCCKGCDLPVFDSRQAMGSDNGYREFRMAIRTAAKECLGEEYGKPRVEIRCACCGSFLGVTEGHSVMVPSLSIVRREISAEELTAWIPEP